MTATRPPMLPSDHIRHLTAGFTTTELIAGHLHTIRHASLLDQLQDTVTGTTMTADGAFRPAYGSKPAGRLDVLAFLHRLERQSHDLAVDLGFETPHRTKTRGRLLPLRDRLSRIAGDLPPEPNRLVRSWWATARVLTQHDGPPYSPDVPCPNVDCERHASIRVRIEERLGVCVECHHVWSDDNPDAATSFGRLAVWVKWATEHLHGRVHLVDDPGVTGYEEALGYRVVCPECEPERELMAARERVRMVAAVRARQAS